MKPRVSGETVDADRALFTTKKPGIDSAVNPAIDCDVDVTAASSSLLWQDDVRTVARSTSTRALRSIKRQKASE